MALELEALISLKDGDDRQALETMARAAAEEDGMPLSFGPPMPSKPAHELLGETLLEMNRPEEAQAEFEKSLERAPRRALSLLGLAQAATRAGDRETAAEAYATLRDVWRSADPGVADRR